KLSNKTTSHILQISLSTIEKLIPPSNTAQTQTLVGSFIDCNGGVDIAGSFIDCNGVGVEDSLVDLVDLVDSFDFDGGVDVDVMDFLDFFDFEHVDSFLETLLDFCN